MGGPWVSVVVPSFQQAPFLREAIDSVLAQDYPRVEVIAMDGGSTDGSVEILASYGDRLRFESGPDAGQADAIHRGFLGARGEVLAWLNSDDRYCPGAISRAVAALEAEPAATMVYGDAELIDERGEVIGPFTATQDFDLWKLARVIDYIMQPTVFMRAAAYREAGGLDQRLHWGLDWDLWIRLACLGPVVRCGGVLAQAREHGAAKTATGGFRRLSELRDILARHGAPGWPPAAVAYGLDTLRKRWPKVFGASTAADLPAARRGLLGKLCAPIQLGVARRIDVAMTRAQGLFGDGWAGPRAFAAVPWRGDGGTLRVEGDVPEGRSVVPLTVEVRAAERRARLRVARAGPFAVDLELPRPGGTPRLLDVEIRCSRSADLAGDGRRLSFRLRSVERLGEGLTTATRSWALSG